MTGINFGCTSHALQVTILLVGLKKFEGFFGLSTLLYGVFDIILDPLELLYTKIRCTLYSSIYALLYLKIIVGFDIYDLTSQKERGKKG